MTRSLTLTVCACAALALLSLAACQKKAAQTGDGGGGDMMGGTATPLPAGPSLFQQLGGEPAIRAVVDDFTAIASVNPKVNFTRKGTPNEWNASADNVAKFKDRMVQFMSLLLGDLNASYQGKDMVTAHKGMRITNAEFDAALADLRQAMTKHNVSEDLQNQVIARVDQRTRDAIVEVAP